MQLKTLLRGCLLALACSIGLQLSAQSSSIISYRASDARVTSSALSGSASTHAVGAIMQTFSPSSAATAVVVPAVSLTPRVQVYKPFTNDVPSSYSAVARRMNARSTDNDDDDLSTDPTVTPGNPGGMAPIGSSAILLLFALAYVAYVATKKRLSNINL